MINSERTGDLTGVAARGAAENAGSEVNMEALMALAIDRQSSDIHLTVGLPPMLRIHGVLVPAEGYARLMPEDTEAAAREITDDTQWEKFVRTREFDFSIGRARVARFRVNLFWQRGSVALAVRAIPHRVPTFDELGLPRMLAKFAAREHGLFVVTGPTGSGKSTSLAAVVDCINRNRQCHIVTIEDPIEYLHRHGQSMINQREMYGDTHSFRDALRHVLRQDPDVILIGEMRDLETIETALTLAETGHLVLTTLHTSDTAQALTRIIDVYPSHQQHQARTQLSLVLIGIMAQHLIKRKDGGGRVVAHELLSATDAVRHMIRANEIQQVYSAIQSGAAEGMCTLNRTLIDLYRQGAISREEALLKSTRQKEILAEMGGSR